jgi:hypothetical protein
VFRDPSVTSSQAAAIYAGADHSISNDFALDELFIAVKPRGRAPAKQATCSYFARNSANSAAVLGSILVDLHQGKI